MTSEEAADLVLGVRKMHGTMRVYRLRTPNEARGAAWICTICGSSGCALTSAPELPKRKEDRLYDRQWAVVAMSLRKFAARHRHAGDPIGPL